MEVDQAHDEELQELLELIGPEFDFSFLEKEVSTSVNQETEVFNLLVQTVHDSQVSSTNLSKEKKIVKIDAYAAFLNGKTKVFNEHIRLVNKLVTCFKEW